MRHALFILIISLWPHPAAGDSFDVQALARQPLCFLNGGDRAAGQRLNALAQMGHEAVAERIVTRGGSLYLEIQTGGLKPRMAERKLIAEPGGRFLHAVTELMSSVRGSPAEAALDLFFFPLTMEEPALFTWERPISDLFGAVIERWHGADVVLVRGVDRNPVALFHEAGEYLIRTDWIALRLDASDLIVTGAAGHSIRLPLGEEALALARRDPSNPHDLLRALQRQAFPELDRRLSAYIAANLDGDRRNMRYLPGHQPEIGQRLGPLRPASQAFARDLRQALRQRQIAPRFADAITAGLARLQPTSLEKAVAWGVLSPELERAVDLVYQDGAMLKEEELTALAAEMVGLVDDLVVAGYTPAQMDHFLGRLVPASVLVGIQARTGLSSADLSEIVERHANFEAWIDQAEAKAPLIDGEVGGLSNARLSLYKQGIEGTDRWIRRIRPVVHKIQGILGGPRDAWYLALRHQRSELPLAAVRLALLDLEKHVDENEALADILHLDPAVLRRVFFTPELFMREDFETLSAALSAIPSRHASEMSRVHDLILGSERGLLKSLRRIARESGVSPATVKKAELYGPVSYRSRRQILASG